jgi:hypothetical protein
LDYFLSFLKKYEERKSHNMFFLIFDPRFKTLCLVSSLIGHEKGKQLLRNITKNLCFLCFLNIIIICILWWIWKGCCYQRVEKDNNLTFIEIDANLEKFEGAFEKDEVMDL